MKYKTTVTPAGEFLHNITVDFENDDGSPVMHGDQAIVGRTVISACEYDLQLQDNINKGITTVDGLVSDFVKTVFIPDLQRNFRELAALNIETDEELEG